MAFRLSNVDVGLLIGTAFGLLYAFVGLPLAWLADRFSRKALIVAGVLIWSGSTIASGFAGTFATLLALRAGLAVGEGVLVPAAHSMIADLFPADRRYLPATILATVPFLATSVGFAVGGLLVGVLDGSRISILGLNEVWRQTFVIVGTPSLMLGVIFAFAAKEPHRAAWTRPASASGTSKWYATELVPIHVLLLLIFGGGLSVMVAHGYNAWAPTMLVGEFGLTTSGAGLWYGAASGFGSVTGSLLLPMLVQRYKLDTGLPKLCIISALLGTIILVVVPLQPSPAILLTGFFFGALTLFGCHSVVMVGMQRLRPRVAALYRLRGS